MGETSHLSRRLFAQLLMGAFEKLRLPHLAHLDAQFVIIEWLGEIILGAGLHRFDGDTLRSVCGDHQNRAFGIDLAYLAKQVHAAHGLHAVVRDDDVERRGFYFLERLFAGLRGIYLVAFFGEQALERDYDAALVVNDQQPPLHCRPLIESAPALSCTVGVESRMVVTGEALVLFAVDAAGCAIAAAP